MRLEIFTIEGNNFLELWDGQTLDVCVSLTEKDFEIMAINSIPVKSELSDLRGLEKQILKSGIIQEMIAEDEELRFYWPMLAGLNREQ